MKKIMEVNTLAQTILLETCFVFLFRWLICCVYRLDKENKNGRPNNIFVIKAIKRIKTEATSLGQREVKQLNPI